MNTAAIGGVVIVVLYCAAQALAGEPALDAQLAQASYVVESAVTTTAVPSLGGDAPPASNSQPRPAAVPAAVVTTPADRGAMHQTMATVPPVPHYEIWLRLAECESGGDWSINTGNGYYGGLQFALASWRGAGGDRYASRPDLASPLHQMLTAERLLEMQGWGAWPTCARRLGLR